MKAIQIDGAIKRYTTIPKTWGNVIAGFDLLSSSEWEAAGFYDVVTPTYNSNTQFLGDLEWNGEASVFTYPVIDRTFAQTLAEMKAGKIASLKAMYKTELEKTDWYIIRAQEGIAIPQDVLDARQALRDESGIKEDEINALTTKAKVADYKLPTFNYGI